jgi:hypothetical protein
LSIQPFILKLGTTIAQNVIKNLHSTHDRICKYLIRLSYSAEIILFQLTVEAKLFFDESDLYAVEPRAKNCTQEGPMCDDCKTRVFCFQLPDGQWIKDPLNTCPGGETCMSSTAQCTNEINVECIVNYKFSCYQRGLFPDAFNCSKYHLCRTTTNGTIDPIPTDYQCSSGYGYDPITTLCNRKLAKCPNDYPCNTVGDSDRIEKHPSLYYTCLSVDVGNGTRELFPQIFYCPDDSLYVNGDCKTPKELSGLNDNGTCKNLGQFYKDDACDGYYNCTAAGSPPEVGSCNEGEKFNPETSQCEILKCIV